jgi:hypothetical protein
MKQTFTLITFIFFIISKYSISQNRIEILVNGVVQNLTSEAIRVKNSNDIIDLRIYFDSTIDKESLIDKVEVKGCKYIEPAFAVQSDGANSFSNFYKPVLKSNYFSIKLKLKKITDCPGHDFNFTILTKGNSTLNNFKAYQKVYNFYYVL